MKISDFQFSILNLKKQKGFTLIELLVAISVTAVLGTLGIAGFVNYNKAQVLETSADEVVTALNLAKSRAQSQIKPSTECSLNSSFTLKGYAVVINDQSSYELKLICSNDVMYSIGQVRKLPAGLGFDADSDSLIVFPVQTGGAQVSGTDDRFIISDPSGTARAIIVNSLGGISVLTPTPITLPWNGGFGGGNCGSGEACPQ